MINDGWILNITWFAGPERYPTSEPSPNAVPPKRKNNNAFKFICFRRNQLRTVTQ